MNKLKMFALEAVGNTLDERSCVPENKGFLVG